MAVTFSKSISTTELLNAYNNNVVEFTSSAIPGGESISKANINIGGSDFEITPISNVLRFNFREVVKVLINSNNHKDTIIPDEPIENDSDLKGSWLVTYTITFSDDTTEQTTKTYVFVKSVEQMANVSTRLLTEQQLLTPNILTFFNGYPFDLSHYSDGNIVLTNTVSGYTETRTSTATNTDRIYFFNNENAFELRVIKDGGTFEENTCWTDRLGYNLLSVGLNTITIVGSTTETLTINLKDVCDGTYLKWLNNKGGWSYWLFNQIHKEKTTVKTLDTFNVDFDSIGETYTTELVTGRSATNSRDLTAKRLTNDEMLQIKDILVSPRIEMFNGSKGDLITASSWQTVMVKSASQIIDNTKRDLINFKLSIKINQYTQM